MRVWSNSQPCGRQLALELTILYPGLHFSQANTLQDGSLPVGLHCRRVTETSDAR